MREKKIAVIAIAGLVCLAGCDSTGVDAYASTRYEEPLDVRYQLDRERGRIWGLTAAGVTVQEGRRAPKIELPLPGWLVVGTAYSCPPALAIGPKGEAVITSNVISTLWRVDPETRAVSEHALELDADKGRDVGLTGLVYSPEHAAYFAVSDGDSLWKIDASLARAERVSFAALPEAVRADRASLARSRCLRAQRLLFRFAQSF